MNQDDEDREAGFAVTVEDTEDGVTAVRVTGEVDQLTAPELSEAIGRALEAPGGTAVLIDMLGVDFLGSAGLAVLVDAATKAEKSVQQLRVVADGAPVLRPLALTGLEAVLTIQPTREAALASLTVSTD